MSKNLSLNQLENSSQKVNYRIASVDGLRAVAVLGVVWAHIWLFCGNSVLSMGKIGAIDLDINRMIASIGTGVDLFFVISGFCMYLMYARKQSHFDGKSYLIFLKNRWLRIAPAFYISVLFCAIGFFLVKQPVSWFNLLSHATFTYLWIPNLPILASPFWSLATEWHFYLLLPIFIWAASRWRFGIVITIAITISLMFRMWMYLSPSDVEIFWKPQIPVRLIEFCWGIIIANFFSKNVKIPLILTKETGFLIGFIIAYFGRILMVTEVVNLAGDFGFICQTFSEPILTLGYALMLWNVIMSNSVFTLCLNHSICQGIGKWSYSLYLWHWYPCILISQQIVKYLGINPISQYFSFVLSLLVMIPISYLSYRYLEEPYFRKRHFKKVI